MGPERLLLIFERSPDETVLAGVGEAIRVLGTNAIAVEAVAPHRGVEGLFVRALRFWFPYLWSEGIVGVTAGAKSSTEAAAFTVTPLSASGPVFNSVLGAWLRVRQGRRIRLQFDHTEIEAQTPDQLEQAMTRIEALREGRGSAPASF